MTPQENNAPSGIEAAVCADIAARQRIGIEKYGTTVADNPLELRQWLQHAYEESLDQAIYLKRAMQYGAQYTAPAPTCCTSLCDNPACCRNPAINAQQPASKGSNGSNGAACPLSDTPETDAAIAQYEHHLPNWLATDIVAALARRMERERDEWRNAAEASNRCFLRANLRLLKLRSCLEYIANAGISARHCEDEARKMLSLVFEDIWHAAEWTPSAHASC